MKNQLSIGSITKLGLLLAVTVVIQWVKGFIPVPSLLLFLGVGTILNASMIYAYETISLRGAIILGLMMPLTTLMQQSFAAPVLIFPAVLANIGYIWGYGWLVNYPFFQMILPAFIRAFVLYVTSLLFCKGFGISDLPVMYFQIWICLAQVVTGIGGVALYRALKDKRKNIFVK